MLHLCLLGSSFCGFCFWRVMSLHVLCSFLFKFLRFILYCFRRHLLYCFCIRNIFVVVVSLGRMYEHRTLLKQYNISATYLLKTGFSNGWLQEKLIWLQPRGFGFAISFVLHLYSFIFNVW